MKVLVTVKHGSYLYGTNVENSDQDYKSVVVPDADSILMQRATGIKFTTSKKNDSVKNTSEDSDTELIPLHQFFKLLIEGQTGVVELLFAPSSLYKQVDSNLWPLVQNVGRACLTSNIKAFASYCRVQAGKYCVKGDRLAAVSLALEILAKHRDGAKVLDVVGSFRDADNEFLKVVNLPHKDGTACWHVEVCNRKMPVTATVKLARECYERVKSDYGQRAKMAQDNGGQDLKALYHAVRVSSEAKELLLTGQLTFPRPDADTLLKIRRGEIPYDKISEMIEQGLVDIEEAQAKSVLAPVTDVERAERLVCRIYAEEVLKAPGLQDVVENSLLRTFIMGVD